MNEINLSSKFLPIGTVCRLKNSDKKCMIIGYFGFDYDRNKKFDYIACLFPEGFVNKNINFSFDHEQIREINYLGYATEEYNEYLEYLNMRAKRYDEVKKIVAKLNN